jgi:hypothetical protein
VATRRHHLLYSREDGLAIGAQVLQHGGGDTFGLLGDADENVLGADVLVVQVDRGRP